MEYDSYLTRMGTDTTGRYDVTPLFADAAVFSELRADLLAEVDVDVTAVVGIDALGFVLGGALAADLDVGFVPVRKGGKLPYAENEVVRRSFTDYSDGEKTLELLPASLAADDHVLVVDDWIETGAQMRTATELVEATGASVAAITVINAHHDANTKGLFDRYDVHQLG